MSSLWKTAALDVSRRSTMPWRAWYAGRLFRSGLAPITILYYHRVADCDPVPWSLTNAQFAAHVDWLAERFDMISLEEAQRRMASGVNRRPAVHITFDDGYAENCEAALPLLIRKSIPATYFVALDNVLRGEPFAHDVRAGKRFAPNTIEQLRELAAAGIEIGAHTRTHPDLGPIDDPDRLHDEIVASRDELQDALGRPVRYFAFPFGMPENLSRAAFRVARDAGFAGVCSAYGGYNFPGDAPFHLLRMHGDPELSRIKNIVTLDPRKLRRPRFPQMAGEETSTSPTVGAGDHNPPVRSIKRGHIMFGRRRVKLPLPDDRGPLRVMFVHTELVVGGAETLLVDIIRNLDRSRFTPELCCLKRLSALGEVMAHEVPTHVGLLKKKTDLGVLGRLTRLLRDRRIDAVVTVGTGGDRMFWGRLAAWRAGVPVILSSLHSTGHPVKVERLNRMLAPISDGFIGCARMHSEFLATGEGCPPEKVFTIYNGVDTERFRPADRHLARRRLGLPLDVPIAGIVAALRPEKQHGKLLDAMHRVVAERGDAMLVVVGDGVERPGIERRIEQLNLRDNVRLLGSRHDVHDILPAFDMKVLASKMEANPASTLEASAYGIPVVAPIVGSLPETVLNDKTGILYPPVNTTALAEAMLLLVSDPEKARALGRAGRELVCRRFSLANMVGGYERLIDGVYRAAARGERFTPSQFDRVTAQDDAGNDSPETEPYSEAAL